MSEEETVKEELEEGPLELKTILSKFPGSPVQEQIDKWKIEHGSIFASGFSENELIVWRPIMRPEWIKLQEEASDPAKGVNQFVFEEKICSLCVLWKSWTGDWATGKAGLATSLHEQILQNSCFLSPQAASMLVVKL